MSIGRKRIDWMVTLALFLVMSGHVSYAATDSELVDRFFPEAITKESMKFQKKSPIRLELGVPADLDNSGSKNYIVAAYSNTLTNVVRVLRKANGTATLVAESNLPCMMGGLRPTIELIDLDNDHKPEILVSFDTPRGATSDWYFKWTDGTLRYFGPADTNEKGWICSAVTTSSTVDLNGDGRLAIIDGPDHLAPDADDYPGKPKIRQAYVISNGRYIKGNPIYFNRAFIRQDGPPFEKHMKFAVDNTGRTYTLRILNGESDGTQRVSSAEIRLNGQLVVGPNQINQKVRVMTVPVSVQPSNIIGVTLKSAPKSTLEVIVEAQN